MKKVFYNLFSSIIKEFSGRLVNGKLIDGFDKILYYEKAQHLTFLFQRKISYETNIQNKLRKFIREGDVIFDIGGNIGQYAIPFSELVGESGKVFSFEPDYKNFSFLQFNKNMNRCNNLICLNYGIGKEDTEGFFFRDTETGGRSGSFKKEFVGAGYSGFNEKVVLKSFDTIVSEFGSPNFVKIDVEGFEEDVLDGLTISLPNCAFFVEVREETKVGIFEYFHKKGFKCFWIENGNQSIYKPEEIPGFSNLIFINN